MLNEEKGRARLATSVPELWPGTPDVVCMRERGLTEGQAPRHTSQACTKLQDFFASPLSECKSQHLELRHPCRAGLTNLPSFTKATLFCPGCFNDVNKENDDNG